MAIRTKKDGWIQKKVHSWRCALSSQQLWVPSSILLAWHRAKPLNVEMEMSSRFLTEPTCSLTFIAPDLPRDFNDVKVKVALSDINEQSWCRVEPRSIACKVAKGWCQRLGRFMINLLIFDGCRPIRQAFYQSLIQDSIYSCQLILDRFGSTYQFLHQWLV